MNNKLQKIHGNKKITTEIFIQKAQKIHGNKYSYTKSSYVRYHNKLIINCIEHGDFQQSPYLHLRGSGCPHCYGNKKSTTENFVQKAQKIHGNVYNYDSVNYINNKTKINIICLIHGIFEQAPTRHLNGDGCPKCGIIKTTNKNKWNTSEFIQKAQKIHNNTYDYSKSDYLGYYKPIKIICVKHGEFMQKPIIHLKGCGCPCCGNNSKGELLIKKFFEKNNVLFVRNKMFDDCMDIGKLKFDFYLPTYNTIVEFDGIQHFKPINVFGGQNEFINVQRRDKIKDNYCEKNNIQLLRIKYNENVENKLIKILNMKDK